MAEIEDAVQIDLAVSKPAGAVDQKRSIRKAEAAAQRAEPVDLRAGAC